MIKTCYLFLGALSSLSLAWGQNTFPSSGNVGIGTTSPGETLDVRGDIRIHDSSYTRLEWFNSSDSIDPSDYWIAEHHNNGQLKFIRRDDSAGIWVNGLILMPNGDVGIGSYSPNGKLHVEGSAYFNSYTATKNFYITRLGDSNQSLEIGVDDNNVIFRSIQDEANNGNFVFRAEQGNSAHRAFSFITDYEGAHDYSLVIKGDGKVGLGTYTPSYDLDINGTARAKEIIVESNWADFVFEEDYELMPLEEVAEHIEKEKRLPGVKDAEEVQAKGASVGETQAMLLQKVEELTLYLIQQQEEISELKHHNAELEARLNTLTP